MKATERMIEAAASMVDLERDQEIARRRAELADDGEDFCIECGDPIGASRKAALPSAKRCIHCQQVHERKARRAARDI